MDYLTIILRTDRHESIPVFVESAELISNGTLLDILDETLDNNQDTDFETQKVNVLAGALMGALRDRGIVAFPIKDEKYDYKVIYVHIDSENIEEFVGGEKVWSGCLTDFANRKAEEKAVQIVRFIYKSGSGKGVRVVKVEKVEGNLLTGIDLVKGAYRSYRLDKIEGEIESCT